MVKCRSEFEKNIIIQRFKELHFQTNIDAFLVVNPLNRRYLSCFTGTSGVLLLTEHKNYLITDFRYGEQARSQARGFEVVEYDDSIPSAINKIVKNDKLTYLGLEKDYVTLYDYEVFVDKIPNIKFLPISQAFQQFRQVKAAEEIALIKKAVEIADKAFLHIKEYISSGITEKNVAFELEMYMRREGAERLAFDTIVASGLRSALPHGVASDKVINSGDLVTMDFGAVFQGYHSDMTRTVFMGKPTDRQKEIYNKVLEAQQQVITCIQPGMKACEVDEIARKIIREAGFGENFGHGLGHGVGLDIHEWPRLSPRDDTPLEPGMIVSVEPGIYLEGWGGVRIEDLVVITKEGCEVLTRSPKTIKEMIITDEEVNHDLNN